VVWLVVLLERIHVTVMRRFRNHLGIHTIVDGVGDEGATPCVTAD
jgi:hypothetical protein